MPGDGFYGWAQFYDDTYDAYHPEEVEEREQREKTKAYLDARVAERMKYDRLNPLEQRQYNQQKYQEWYAMMVQSLENISDRCGWEKAEKMRRECEAHHRISLPEIRTNNPNLPIEVQTELRDRKAMAHQAEIDSQNQKELAILNRDRRYKGLSSLTMEDVWYNMKMYGNPEGHGNFP